jgi:hypothetical protein
MQFQEAHKMPNWCDQELYVRGKKEDLESFKLFAKTDEKCLDEKQFIPMPKSLLEVPAGSGEELYSVWYGSLLELDYPWIPAEIKGDREKLKEFFRDRYKKTKHDNGKNWDVEKIAEQYKFNKDNYGCLTWYDWAIQNWGSKWGICNASLKNEAENELFYGFDSAWSPVTPVILKMSGLFPNLGFILKYWECGCAFKGEFVCKNGKVIKDLTEVYIVDEGEESRGG